MLAKPQRKPIKSELEQILKPLNPNQRITIMTKRAKAVRDAKKDFNEID